MPGNSPFTARLRLARLVAVTLVFLAVKNAPYVSAQTPHTNPVILISIDTLRADHLSCYGYKALQTPHIDGLTHGGTLFGQISSQAPLTLPSHVSFLTSTLPVFNGNEDNSELMAPNMVTLAATLKSQGYRTAAFVGGFVLDKRFGLDRGFETYDSPFKLESQNGIDPMDLKRSAEEVTAAAMHWLESNRDHPFFLFIHLYDLHTPYKLSPELRARFPGRGYDAALSYVDKSIGNFWEFLARQELVDKALIVLLSDHGEGLGDHSESSHGFFIYQSTLRVPLMIHWPAGTGPFPARVDDAASLVDVAPSILQFLHVQRPPQFQGRSVLELLGHNTSANLREIYSESLYAHNHFGCSPLRSIRIGRFKFIDAPKPELYDLASDPNELTNLYSTHKDLALHFRERLGALRARYASTQRSTQKIVDPELVQRLASLGYVAASSGHSAPESGVDPKDRILAYRDYRHAIAVGLAGNLEESADLLEVLAKKVPDLADVWNLQGMTQQRMGQNEKAIVSFREALAKDPLHVLAHYFLGVSYLDLNRPDEATREFQATLAIAAKSGTAMNQVTIPAQEFLGKIYMQKGEWAPARVQFEQLLKVSPNDYVAHFNLAYLAGREGHLDEAADHLRQAVQAAPQSAEAHNALGSIYLFQGNIQAAEPEISKALELDPKFSLAYFNLGRLYLKTGKNDEAANAFRKALEINPQLQPARDALRTLEPSGG